MKPPRQDLPIDDGAGTPSTAGDPGNMIAAGEPGNLIAAGEPGGPDRRLFRRLHLPPEQDMGVQVEALPGVRVVVRRYRWILLGAAIGLLLGGLVAVLRPPTYVSTAYLSVSSAGQRATPLDLSRAAQALARLATAPSVMSAPLREAGLGGAADQPRLAITSRAAPDAALISLAGRDADPAVAQRIAQVSADTLVGLETIGDFRATVVAEPTVPTAPLTARWVAPFGGALAGFGLAFVVAATAPAGRDPREG